MQQRGLIGLCAGAWVALLLGLMHPLDTQGRPPDVTAPLRVYAIGNSLTVDSLHGPERLQPYLDANQLSIEFGYHIRCFGTLARILAHPEESCGERKLFAPAPWPEALKQPYDVIVLQPWIGVTFEEEVAAMSALILYAIEANPENANARFYYLAVWPGFAKGIPLNQQDFTSIWEAPVDISDDVAVIANLNRATHEHLYAKLQAELSGEVDLGLIPVGAAFAEAHRLFVQGEAAVRPSVPAYAFYRDRLHASHELGRWLSANVCLAILRQTDPRAWTIDEAVHEAHRLNERAGLHPWLPALRETAWEVVLGEPRSGVAAATEPKKTTASEGGTAAKN